MNKWWNNLLEGVEKYTIHPTDSYEGRLQFNENLWGPSPKCVEVLKGITLNDFIFYDLEEKDFLIEGISNLININYENIFLNNGSSEVLKSIFSSTIGEGDAVLIPDPGWGCYKGMIEARRANVVFYNVSEGENEYYHDIDDINVKAKESSAKIIIITSPQMPTGNRISEKKLETVLLKNPNSLIIVDECYYGCAEMDLNINKLISEYDNVVFVRSLSKIYGLANLRVGYGVANEKWVNIFDYVMPLHKLPNLVRRIALAAIEDVEYTEKNKREIIDAREYLTEQLNRRIGVKAFKSYSNFVYIKMQGVNAVKIHDYMEKQGISTRLFIERGETHMRITVAPKEILDRALTAMDEGLSLFG